MPRKLVIVESPTKSRTIGGYLGDDYDVVSSVGHIRDLAEKSELPEEVKKSPAGEFSIDIDGGFMPYYRVDPGKKKVVADMKKRLKEADELYLATDEDREGEAIAWHLLEVLKPKVPVKRLAFHEITKEGIARALQSPREVDMELVEAQEARRILDRLYGYSVSPVLWRKIQGGLSAGRVQSIALRLVVDRERERMAFRSAEYWDLQATFTAKEGPDAGRSFVARLTTVDGKRVATGKDFDDRGVLKSDKVTHITAATAGALAAGLASAEFTVAGVDSKPYKRRPAAPFITSTLIQESSRKLRLGARDAMRVAQGLYERGYITYMRSDSPGLSGEATRAARAQALELFGADAVAPSARVYASKDSNAQEAHEAIRPAGDTFRTPDQLRAELRGDEFRMYEMIWKRTIASQMADAVGTTSTVRLAATTAEHHAVEFSKSGTIITQPGFMAVYEETREKSRYEEDDAPTSGGKADDDRLPQLTEGQAVDAADLEPLTHSTTPPPRFTQGSMIKELEDRKFGRPSTYASMVDLIIARGYVRVDKQALVPTWLAFAIIRLLEEHFGWLVDYDFTADMEEDLDRIAQGGMARVDWLSEFYFGSGEDADGRGEGLKNLVDNLGEIDARAINTFSIGDGIELRVGRYGPYIQRPKADGDEGEMDTASVPEELAPDELTVAKANELFENQGGDERSLGTHPDLGTEIVAKAGRFGPYVTEVLPEGSKQKPKTASLFKSMDLATVTLEDAVKLMELPRVVGKDPATDEEITAQNGRYGPYLKKGTDSRTIESEEQLLSITLDEALAIYAQPKRGRGRTAKPPLKELGVDPVSEKPIVVKEGRFGEYITDGVTNITIPRGTTVDELTHERAVELLQEKREKAPAKKPARKTAAKKKTTTTRKAAPKKK
ncbi:type I DNA topoisomerase [Demequina zhanjiangensis]|uniref:DNA topoisomerase 1 n=1 Tax=Demequina zhanjiangensis TaxID=3051659 RepID=A0ABT8FYX1_9MICO|nr:type I DNA topoisomerase [Demequina sp. SYSU T00b26]MDN4472085.1 type I DNA topoisomerase [Demequina sp. SYSU T00b26]